MELLSRLDHKLYILASQDKFGVFQFTSTASRDDKNKLLLLIQGGQDGGLFVHLDEVHKFYFDNAFSYFNILRKWSKFCIAIDTKRNKVQVALNGRASEVLKDPQTGSYMLGRVDGDILRKAPQNSQTLLKLGEYAWDGNPFIGTMANINVWDRTMETKDLQRLSDCGQTFLDKGNLVNNDSVWKLTGTLLKRVDILPEIARCDKKENIKVSAFLPIPKLTRQEAVDLCQKFGTEAHIAGDFETKEDFDAFYSDLYASEKYVETCGFHDNGRLLTWLPYKHNEDSSDLIHEISYKALLWKESSKFYLSWYSGPSTFDPNSFIGAYFGIVPKYQNIGESYASTNKRCTACEIQKSIYKTTTLNLRGLCPFSQIDTIYQAEYDSVSTVYFVGKEKSIINYDFDKEVWRIQDVTDPKMEAVSFAPYRTLAVGNIEWNVTNDGCYKEPTSIRLSLTSCSDKQYTCNNGLCIGINKRSVE